MPKDCGRLVHNLRTGRARFCGVVSTAITIVRTMAHDGWVELTVSTPLPHVTSPLLFTGQAAAYNPSNGALYPQFPQRLLLRRLDKKMKKG